MTASLRSIAIAFALVGAAASCSVIFDYSPDDTGQGGNAAGSGGSSQATGVGGSGGGAVPSCDGDGDCVDASSCTEDRCVEGSCSNEPLTDGTECQNGGGEDGLCEGGVCVVTCTANDVTVCDDDNPCTLDGCNTDVGQCENTPVPDGPLAEAQTEGDCKSVVCSSGVQTEIDDDSDVFVDGNDCTDDLCNAGTPSNPNRAEGSSCGGSLVCNNAGVCVGCNQPSDCAGSNTFCQTVTCQNSQCGVSNTASGTALPAGDQTAGPCKERQCDGSGGIQTVNRPTGTSCNDNLYCNGADSCLSGNCSQHGGDPCFANIGDGDNDCSEACNESNDTCTANDPSGSACNDGAYCNGADTCNGTGSCSQHAGDPCAGQVNDGDGDCSEACNETNDNCTANDPNGGSCNDGLYCNGNDTCQNGSCSQHTGDPCAARVGDGDGDCSEACNETNNNCTANDPSGSSCSDGLYCNGSDTCNGSGSCSQHAGDPCQGGLRGTCSNSCNEVANNCTALDPEGASCLTGMGLGCCSGGQCYPQCP